MCTYRVSQNPFLISRNNLHVSIRQGIQDTLYPEIYLLKKMRILFVKIVIIYTFNVHYTICIHYTLYALYAFIQEIVRNIGFSVQLGPLCTAISPSSPFFACVLVVWLVQCATSKSSFVLLYLSAEKSAFVLTPKSAVNSSRQTIRIFSFITTSLMFTSGLYLCVNVFTPNQPASTELAKLRIKIIQGKTQYLLNTL